MSASVRISRKLAQSVAATLAAYEEDELAEGMRKALVVSPKKAAARKANKAKRATGRETAKESRADIRCRVVVRAQGRCENCNASEVDWAKHELDHARGRGRSETFESCWLLCRTCHRAKTLSTPSAADWLERFVSHCLKHGYIGEARLARNRLAFVTARGELSAQVSGVGA